MSVTSTAGNKTYHSLEEVVASMQNRNTKAEIFTFLMYRMWRRNSLVVFVTSLGV